MHERRFRERLSLVAATVMSLALCAQAFSFPTPLDEEPMARTSDSHVLFFSVPPVATGILPPEGTAGEAQGTTAVSADGLLPGLPDGFVVETVEPVEPSRATRPGPSKTGLAASRTAPGSGMAPDTSNALLIPLGNEVGAAMLRRGDDVVIFFDTPDEFSLPRDGGIFPDASVGRSGESTWLRLKVPVARDVRLCRVSTGWMLTRAGGPACPPTRTIDAERHPEGVFLPAPHAGRILHAFDPVSHRPLLIGTALDEGFGQLAQTASSPAGELLESGLGVIAVPRSDIMQIERQEGGDLVTPWGGPASGSVAASVATRTLNLPGGDILAARQRLDHAQQILRQQPTPGLEMLVEASEASLAVGDGWKAVYYAQQAHARLGHDDPSGDRVAMLGTIGRNIESYGRQAVGSIPAQSDEAAAWRAALSLRQAEISDDACRRLVEVVTVFSSYPDPLRARILPPMAEALANCAPASGLAWFAHAPSDAGLRLAKAIAALRQGGSGAPLAALDHLASDPDPVVAYKAEMLDVRERLGRHLIDARDAAARVDRLIFAARMAGDEDHWRLRLTELLLDGGQMARAVDTLSQVSPPTPASDRLLSRLMLMLGQQRREDGRLETDRLLLKAAKLLDAGGHATDEARVAMAEALLRGGLAHKAIEVLPPTRATVDPLHWRSLAVRVSGTLDLGDSATAKAALDANAGSHPEPPELLSIRLLADFRMGDCDAALDTVRRLKRPLDRQTSELRARCLSQAGQWADAESAWHQIATGLVVNGRLLTASDQDVILRYINAASRAGDEAVVERTVSRFADSLDPATRPALMALQKLGTSQR